MSYIERCPNPNEHGFGMALPGMLLSSKINLPSPSAKGQLKT